MKKIIVIMMLLVFGCSMESEAQNIVNRIARRAERAAVNAVERNVSKKVENAVNEAVDEAFEETEKKAEKEIEKAEKEIKEAEKEIIEAAEEMEAVQKEIEEEEATIFQDAVSLDEYDFSIDYELVADPFFGYKEGVKLTFADLDKKGKPTAHSVNEITKLEGEAPFNCTVEYTVSLLDDKKNPLGIEMVQSYSIRNGIVTFDEDSFAGQMLQGMEVKISGTLFRLPSNAKVGDTFEDYSVLINMGGIKSTAHVTNIRITAEETLTIDGVDIECVVVENNTASKAIGIKSEGTQKIWYGRGYGAVRTETYDKKGKILTTNALVEID
ncbi:MAG: hypothetical protein E7066_08930 [Lentimicrobiaceae bacterium]|nr:hypothetical protein [Lentimicrobiaceae bacterium]